MHKIFTLSFVVVLGLGCAAEIEIPFSAAVGDDAWSCGSTFDNIGTSASTITPKDFRVYIHDITLGGEPVALADNEFQNEGVVLLDFEDGTGACTGDARINTVVRGAAPVATGDLSFKLGVPFEQNHQDNATAPAPLDIPALFWGWEPGYKFVRIDHATTGLDQHSFHLGSTGCEVDENGLTTSCANENRTPFTFALEEGTTIVFDINELFAESDVDVNTPETPPGCLSMPTDPECDAIFDNLNNFVLAR